MSLRHSCALLVAVLLLAPGCCCLQKAPWPCGGTYYGAQCGCKYWHEWCSHKPMCCECCDECGNFTCSDNPYVVSGPPYTRFGPLYSDGRRSRGAGAIGQMYPASGGPTPAAPTPEPTPAAEPEGVLDAAPPEELPGPTTMSPGGTYPGMANYGGPVDSPRYSRTLGKPPRTRLFTR
jgi:hypothetical protein